MGVDIQGFNAAEVAPNVPRQAKPAGWYNGILTASDSKPTKDGSGWFIELQLQHTDGPYSGTTETDRLNLGNTNADAVRIARGTLSAICHAVGVLLPGNTSALHNRPLQFRLEVRPGGIRDGKEYGPSNEVKEYSAPGKHAVVTKAEADAYAAQLAAAKASAPQADAGAPVSTWQPPAGAVPGAAAAPAGGWTPPAGAQPFAAAPAPAAPAAAPVPAPVAPPAVAAPVAPVKTMTAKANGATYEQFIAANWTDAQMIEQGMMVLTQPAAPAAPVAPAAPAGGWTPPAGAPPTVGAPAVAAAPGGWGIPTQ